VDALDLGLSAPWARERIHLALWAKVTLPSGALDLGEFVAAELMARAVEARVCRAFDVKYDVKHWADVSLQETLFAYQLRLPSVAWVVDGIQLHMERPATLRMAQRIQRLR
jgi:hypothetical protein